MKPFHWQDKLISTSLNQSLVLFSVVTSHDRLFSSHSHQLGPPTWHYLKLSDQIFAISGGGEQARTLALICECVCVWIFSGTMNGCAGEQLYMLFVFSQGKCTVSILWRTPLIYRHCTCCVFMSTFVTVKSRWWDKTFNTWEFLSTT